MFFFILFIHCPWHSWLTGAFVHAVLLSLQAVSGLCSLATHTRGFDVASVFTVAFRSFTTTVVIPHSDRLRPLYKTNTERSNGPPSW